MQSKALRWRYRRNGNTGAAWVFTQPSFFTGEDYLGSSIYYLQFPDGNPFGYYGYLGSSWLYHMDLGYEYVFAANDAANSVYLWDMASGHWWYTNPSLFPYLYDFTRNAMLWYDPSSTAGRYTSNPRWFYDFSAQAWITL